MTIASGSKIFAADYNAIQSKVADILGTGSGNKGYGQTVTSSQVSAGGTITALQMQNLKTDLNKIAYHQNNAATSAPSIVANTRINASDWISYSDQAASLETSRFTLSTNASQSTKTTNLQPTYISWNGLQTHNVTVDFGSANAGRYFFNTGGEILLEPSHTGDTLGKGASWRTLFASFIPVRVKASTTSASAGTGTNIGWYGLTTSNQTIFTMVASGTYAGNSYTVKARCDVADNSSGTARYLYLTIELNDSGSNPSADLNVDGTTTDTVSNIRATGSYVSVPAPTVSDNYVTPGATYSLSASPATQSNEGTTVTFTLTTTGLASGTSIPYTVSGTAITVSDFGGASLTGNFVIDASGIGTISYNISNDATTEGNETFTLSLNNGQASINYTIVDTSQTPAASYSVTPAASSVNEGSSLTFNVSGSNITNGTYYWGINNSTTSNADFSATSGSFTITSNAGSFSVTATADSTTEGSETFTVSIYSGSVGGTLLATSSSVTINDTSTTPSPTYSVTPTASSVDEGSSLTFNVSGTNITNGTYYWAIANATTVDADFSAANGSFTITSNTGSFTVSPVADSTTEGSQTFAVTIRSGSIAGSILATSSIVTVNDTSTTPGSPTYAFGTIPSSIDEGSSGTFNVNTTLVSNGTTLYWTINNTTTVDADFSAVSGSFTINSNTGSFTVSPVADTTTEGSQTFTVSIRTGSTSGTVVDTSASVTVNDTSTTPAPTYSVTPAASSVDEGSSLTFNVSGTNITNGTYYWTVTNSGDFGTSSGSFTITSNSGSFSVTPTADSTTEGSETFTASIRSGSISGTVLATSSSVTINDTSTTPAPTYSITPSSSLVNEDSVLTVNVGGTNITNGTYYWTIDYNSSSNSSDFVAVSGSFTITSNSGSFSVSMNPDLTTEGSETFKVEIRSGSISGTVLATSSTITINDSSTTPAPTYSVSPAASSVDEGSSLTFNVSGTNITNGTYYWTINNTTTADADFSAVSGSFTITSNSGSFSVTATADSTTEGAQTFTVSIRTGSTSGTVVATSSSVTINDTSTTPAPTYSVTPAASSVDEGSSLTFNVSGTNITNGTYYWTINNTTTVDADFSAVSGSFTITSNSGSFSVTATADNTTEGAQTFTVSIRTGSTSGTVVATSSSVTINDTSITPTGSQLITNQGYYSWIVPAGVTEVNALVIGAGGSGGGGSGRTAYAGYYTGGGGGGSGAVYYTCFPVTPGQSFTIYVGDGRAGGTTRDGIYSSGSDGTQGGQTYALYDPTGAYVAAFGGLGGVVAPGATGGAGGSGGGVSTTYDVFSLVSTCAGTTAGTTTTKGGRGAPGYTINTTTGTALGSIVGYGSYGTSYAEGSGQSSTSGTGYGAGGTGGGCVQSDVFNPANMYSTASSNGAAFLWYGYSTVKSSASYGGGATPPTAPTDYPAAGTLLSTYCSGYDLYGTYADGSGGTYDSLIAVSSTSCGYVDPGSGG